LLWLWAQATAEPIDGERIRWEASWMGIVAGSVEASLERTDDRWVATVATRSADWLGGLYPIDDKVVSTWMNREESARYATIFREGRFQQDQTMEFSGTEILVHRRQLFDDGWREWDDRYPPHPAVRDPISAVYHLRREWTETLSFDAFSGRKVVPIAARDTGGDAGVTSAEGVATRRIEVTATGGTDFRPWMTVWLTDDDARVPVRAVVTTRGGPVTLTMTSRTVSP
jgi:hypothetical protein